jgi:hypothetical protein
LPAKRRELMAQDEQLDVFGELAATASDKQPKNSREREVSEGKEHPTTLPEPTALRRPENRGFETPQANRLASSFCQRKAGRVTTTLQEPAARALMELAGRRDAVGPPEAF